MYVYIGGGFCAFCMYGVCVCVCGVCVWCVEFIANTSCATCLGCESGLHEVLPELHALAVSLVCMKCFLCYMPWLWVWFA